MTKNEMRIYVEKTIEHYLDELQQRTRNYQDTFDLFDMDPQEIMFLRNNEKKLLVSALSVCKNSIPIKKMEVTFSGGTFRVKIKSYKIIN